MDHELYQLAKEILIAALDQPGDEQDAFVRRRCGGRADLLREVQSLLAQQATPSALVTGGVVQVTRSVPESIGPYTIREVLGEGGMGIVYRALQTSPIRREVAVKVLHAGLNTARILERFAWERRSLARMNHPNIAKILDAGTEESGHPYVVLELVDGTPITTWCREQKGTLARNLNLMARVCQAVQHAHDRGVLHRDLKPGNILVREIDGQPTPSIIDFGIAKALDDTDAGEDSLNLTLAGQQVGTPAYMSPEQLAGSGDVDVRTDVYALGVILYELLAGRRPFPDDHLRQSKSRDNPPPPSQISGRRELRGDLDNICLMALRVEPGRRYHSAADLAADIDRQRSGQPVTASPDSWRYRAGKSARRHPILVTLGVSLLVFALAGVGFLGYHAQRLNRERDRALAAEKLAQQEASAAAEIATFMEGLFIDMDPIEDGVAPTTAVQLLDNGATRLTGELADQPANRGRLWGVMGRVNQNIARHEIAEEQLRASLAAFAEVSDTNATLASRAETWRMLAICLHDQGKYHESELAFRQTLRTHRLAFSTADIMQVQVITDLATAIQAQSRYQEALDLMEEAIALARTLGSEGEAEVAYIMNIKGYILYKRGAYTEALRDMENALAFNRRQYPAANMALVSSLNNVGGMNLELGRYAVAESLISESRDMLLEIYQGQPHPAITRANLHLARIAMATGDTATAVAGYEAAYQQSLRQLGPDNPDTWRSREGLAAARIAQGRLPEARTILQEVLQRWENRVGPRDAKTLSCRMKLGRLLMQLGDLANARRDLEAVTRGYQEGFAPGHPRLYSAQVVLAEILLEQGHDDEARGLLQKAVPELERIYGSDYALCRQARDLLRRVG